MRARLAIAVLIASGCATTPPPKKEVVWPDPPDTARIRFVMAFRQTSDLDNSGWSRFKRAVFGGEGEPGIGMPMGIAVSDDGQRVYVADFGQAIVHLADFEKKKVSVFSPDESVGKPFNVALDDKENVYVSDQGGRLIRVFAKDGTFLKTLASGQLERPTGLAIDRKRGLIYVSDTARKDSVNHRVRVFDMEGKWKRDLGYQEGRASKGSGDGQFHFPTYLTLDDDGNVYVADTMNFRIQVFDPEGKFLRKFGEHGDGPATFARLKGMAFDGHGNLYVVDGGHSNVQLFNRDFQPLMFFGGYAQRLEYFDVPCAIAIDRKNNRIYVGNEFISRINVYELINTKPEDSTNPSGPEEPKSAAR
ncbi:MAG: hypothetical protein HYZ28_12610 [Myxococcales bacterium]|nr:hypothetical protein [Myxococcales bacterium]